MGVAKAEKAAAAASKASKLPSLMVMAWQTIFLKDEKAEEETLAVILLPTHP